MENRVGIQWRFPDRDPTEEEWLERRRHSEAINRRIQSIVRRLALKEHIRQDIISEEMKEDMRNRYPDENERHEVFEYVVNATFEYMIDGVLHTCTLVALCIPLVIPRAKQAVWPNVDLIRRLRDYL